MREYPARRPDSGGRSAVFGTRGAVAREHPRAALAGIRTLDDEGNTADACVAMAASMAVLAPMATSMGGDAFLLFYDAGTRRVLGAGGAGHAAGRIYPDRAACSLEPFLGEDTICLCAVNAKGSGCSFINSLFMCFGSGIVAEGARRLPPEPGSLLPPRRGPPEHPRPRQATLHTIIPGLATKDGELWAAFGVMGGPMQPQGHVQLLSNLVDHEMAPQEAVDHPRHFHHGDTLLVEGRVPEREIEKLRALGHNVEVGRTASSRSAALSSSAFWRAASGPAGATRARTAAPWRIE